MLRLGLSRCLTSNQSLLLLLSIHNLEQTTELLNQFDLSVSRASCRFNLLAAVADTVSQLVIKTGLVTQASGSVYIETGRTKMICAV